MNYPTRKIDARVRRTMVDRVEREIRKANKRLSVKELSRRTGVSRNFIIRNVTGRHLVLYRSRIEKIRESPQRLLTEAAKDVGFKSYQNFYRACRMITGKSPKQVFGGFADSEKEPGG